MSVIRAVSKSYGPAQIDIQIEQGADFVLPVTIQVGDPAAALPLDGVTVEAWFSPQWAPGGQQIALTITNRDDPSGSFDLVFPAADSLALNLPYAPRKGFEPKVFELGGWILHITKNELTFRYAEGRVFMDRAPWLT